MKRTLIFYKPEYADLAIKLRDNYRAHIHEADIVSVEKHDDVDYAEKMQYDEAVFIEDSDTVTFHDIESGYTKRRPVSDVFYNDFKSTSHEAVTSRDTLNILADAISDVGAWWCWHVGDDMLQLEFCDVQLYDETKAEKEIEPLSRKWWEYWKNYWRLRGTRDALPKDYACEVTIPVDKEDPQGNW